MCVVTIIIIKNIENMLSIPDMITSDLATNVFITIGSKTALARTSDFINKHWFNFRIIWNSNDKKYLHLPNNKLQYSSKILEIQLFIKYAINYKTNWWMV